MVYKAAIIGCGNIAGGYDKKIPDKWTLTHAGAYHLCPDTILHAVADSNLNVLKKFQEKWHVKHGYVDYNEMLEKESIDILSICLPTEYHFEALQVAANQDIKAIFCEKPLSHDLDKAHRMVELSRGRIVLVNYFRRWNTTLGDIADDIKNGIIERKINITLRYTKGLLGNGSHLVDLVRWFFGEPEEIHFLRNAFYDPIDPGVDFLMKFDGGTIAHFINVPEVDYVFIDVDILTDNSRIIIEQRGQKIQKFSKVKEPYYSFNILENNHKKETEWQYCMTKAVQEIVDHLKNGKGQITCSANDGLRALEICHTILGVSKENVEVIN